MAGPRDFIDIPARVLAELAEDSDRIPRLYYAENWLLRKMFWQRLHRLNTLINRYAEKRGTCLDFGGGSGVMLPTLAQKFSQVTLVDLEARQAKQIKERFDLKNVEIVEGDVTALDLGENAYDIVVAADVLEHFRDLEPPVRIIRNWLKPTGVLFTSLPTETGFYVLLRKVFSIEKPWDHYHTADEVETRLQSNGFKKLMTQCVPLGWRILPLFLVTAWRRTHS